MSWGVGQQAWHQGIEATHSGGLKLVDDDPPFWSVSYLKLSKKFRALTAMTIFTILGATLLLFATLLAHPSSLSCLFGYENFTDCYMEETASCSGVESTCKYQAAKLCGKKFPKRKAARINCEFLYSEKSGPWRIKTCVYACADGSNYLDSLPGIYSQKCPTTHVKVIDRGRLTCED